MRDRASNSWPSGRVQGRWPPLPGAAAPPFAAAGGSPRSQPPAEPPAKGKPPPATGKRRRWPPAGPDRPPGPAGESEAPAVQIPDAGGVLPLQPAQKEGCPNSAWSPPCRRNAARLWAAARRGVGRYLIPYSSAALAALSRRHIPPAPRPESGKTPPRPAIGPTAPGGQDRSKDRLRRHAPPPGPQRPFLLHIHTAPSIAAPTIRGEAWKINPELPASHLSGTGAGAGVNLCFPLYHSWQRRAIQGPLLVNNPVIPDRRKGAAGQSRGGRATHFAALRQAAHLKKVSGDGTLEQKQ